MVISGKQAWEQIEEKIEDEKLARAEERLQKRRRLLAAELEIAEIEKQAQTTDAPQPEPARMQKDKLQDPFTVEERAKQNVHRKDVVSKAQQMKEEDPRMQWKEIARKLDVAERTLRDWRHNPKYQ